MHDLFSELYFQLITRVKAQEKKVDHLEHAKRKEEQGMKWLKEQEEERQRRRDEELKRQREEKECLEQERKEAEEEEYRKKKELLDAQAKRQQEREKEMEERQKQKLSYQHNWRSNSASPINRNQNGSQFSGFQNHIGQSESVSVAPKPRFSLSISDKNNWPSLQSNWNSSAPHESRLILGM